MRALFGLLIDVGFFKEFRSTNFSLMRFDKVKYGDLIQLHLYEIYLISIFDEIRKTETEPVPNVTIITSSGAISYFHS